MKTDLEIKELAELKYYPSFANKNLLIEDRIIDGFIDGYKQAQKELYSEDDMKEAFNAGCAYTIGGNINFKQTHPNFKEWFNQNKKK